MNAITLRGRDLQQAVAQLNDQLATRAEQFKMVLPSHITPDKFQRTLLTAVQQNPDLLVADRQSFLTSCMKAAQDALLPDGREAALVVYNTRQKIDGQWVTVKQVQYLPMVYGLRKKILQSKEVAAIEVGVVYAAEVEAGDFYYRVGVEPPLGHRPSLTLTAEQATDDQIVAAYSIATMKDGTKSYEVMRRFEIDKVRQCSQTGALGRTDRQGKPIEAKGPWVEWFPEQAKKTVLRRHSKVLPQSGDIMIDVEGQELEAAARSSVAALGLAAGGEPQAIEDHSDETHDAVTGEVIEKDAGESPDMEPETVLDAVDAGDTDELGVTRDPAESKANQIIDEIKACKAKLDVDAVIASNQAHINAMGPDIATVIHQTAEARKAEIAASRGGKGKAEAPELGLEQETAK